MAIDREVVVRARPRADGLVTARSDALAGAVELPADGDRDPGRCEPRWGRPLAAVLRLLARPGRAAVGFDAEVTSTVPVGSGLSSSAAFAVAATITAGEIGGDDDATARAIARIAQAAETGRHRRAVRRDGPDGIRLRPGRSRAAARLPEPRRRTGGRPLRADAAIVGRAHAVSPAGSRTAPTRNVGRRARRRPQASACSFLAGRVARPGRATIRSPATSCRRTGACSTSSTRCAPATSKRAGELMVAEPRVAPRRLRGVDTRARRARLGAARRRVRTARASPAPASAGASSPWSRRTHATASSPRPRRATVRSPARPRRRSSCAAVDGAGIVTR